MTRCVNSLLRERGATTILVTHHTAWLHVKRHLSERAWGPVDNAKQVADEDRAVGKVGGEVWREYLRTLGAPIAVLLVGLFTMQVSLSYAQQWRVTRWSAEAYGTGVWFYIYVYSGISLTATCFVLARIVTAQKGASGTMLAKACVQAAQRCSRYRQPGFRTVLAASFLLLTLARGPGTGVHGAATGGASRKPFD